MTMRDRMLNLMDSLISIVDRVAKNENAKPEEIAALPALVESIVNITRYAVIEKKD